MDQQIPGATPKRRMKLATRLALAFALLAVVTSGIVAATLYINFRNQLRQDLRQRVTNIAAIAALQQDGDKFKQILSNDDPIHEEFRTQNLKIRRSDPDIAYVFTATRDPNGKFYFVVDAGEPGEEGVAVYGERYDDPSPTLKNNYDTMTKAIADPDIYTDAYGSFLSAYAPIFTADGERVGVIGVDFLADTVVAKEKQFLYMTLGVFLALMPFVLLLGWIAGTRIARPIIALTNVADKFAHGDLTFRAKALDINIEEVSQLAISFDVMATRLTELIGNLEQRVSDRTIELETASRQVEHRADQMKLISDIGQTISTVRELDILLPVVANTISERFGFYHTGIYLLDESKEYAILQAASSEGGQRMIAAKHRLRVGAEGIVGNVARTGKPRIALDIESDLAYQASSFLPNTRSEAALPITRGTEIIGVLDVESDQPNEFSSENIQILTTLATQVSVAIENAMLLTQTRNALIDAERITRQYVQQQWSGRVSHPGYLFNGNETYLLGTEENPNQETVTLPVIIPIMLRGQSIGRLEIKPRPGKSITEEEKAIAQIAAERSALALENARLIEESQLRVATERAIGDISAKLNSSPDIDMILRTAVQELGQVILDSNISLQLLTGDTQPPAAKDGQNG